MVYDYDPVVKPELERALMHCNHEFVDADVICRNNLLAGPLSLSGPIRTGEDPRLHESRLLAPSGREFTQPNDRYIFSPALYSFHIIMWWRGGDFIYGDGVQRWTKRWALGCVISAY